MTVFLLIRHAAHIEQGRRLVGRLGGLGLSERGIAEARALAEGLKGRSIEAIATSPRERAQSTAAELNRQRGLKIAVDIDLDEIDYGEWTGRRPAELDGDPRWHSWNSLRATHRVPGGESMHEVQARMVRASERFCGQEPEGAVALVSHQDPLRALLAHWLGMPLDFVLRLDLEPASVSTVEVTRGWPRLVELNRRFL